uniref:Uncharacterized protein n=1 Tax=Solibacter usitatus (strain Ellin6076) TaxID=234267 RepID=Q020B3_SOLUE
MHCALAYYFDYMDDIQQEMRAEREFAEDFRREHASLLEAKLGQQLRDLRRPRDRYTRQ